MDFERVESSRGERIFTYISYVKAKKFGGMQFFSEEFINPSNEKCFFEIIFRFCIGKAAIESKKY